MVMKQDAGKFTSLQVPRESGLIPRAKELARILEKEAEAEGTKVPMYAAICLALTEAIDDRQAQEDE